jgi:hypothetical protein
MTKHLTLSAALLALTSCAPVTGPVDDTGPDTSTEDEATEVARAGCDAPVGGPSWWPLDTTEGQAGYDDELEALDLEALPATIDISFESDFVLSIVAYALEEDIVGLTSLDRDALLEHAMGRAVLGAVATADPTGTDGVDIPFLRRGLHRFYACDRGLPLHLDDFTATYFDHTVAEPTAIIEDSQPKGGTRQLYESSDATVFVAETIDDDGSVRETEILVLGDRADLSLDFLVYDRDGKLADRSEFATIGGSDVVGAAPYTCMTCHRNNDTDRYDVLMPVMR